MTHEYAIWSEQATGLFVDGACAKPSTNGQRPGISGPLGMHLSRLQSHKR